MTMEAFFSEGVCNIKMFSLTITFSNHFFRAAIFSTLQTSLPPPGAAPCS
jgi:hypothetical protein